MAEPAMALPGRSRRARGAGLIEFLVAIVVLSFGLLAVGAMVAYGAQLPKMSANRVVAGLIANDLIERMRANAAAFHEGHYAGRRTYDGSSTVPPPGADQCNYPQCTPAALAAMDLAVIHRQLRQALPAGGFVVDTAGSGASSGDGLVYILWHDPPGPHALNTSDSDVCPQRLAAAGTTPRCISVRFRL